MQKAVLYRTDTGMVVAIKETNWSWGAKETDGDPLQVIILDLNQTMIDDIEANGIPIQDAVSSGCIQVNTLPTPTNIERVE